jgi:hypothetical protein
MANIRFTDVTKGGCHGQKYLEISNIYISIYFKSVANEHFNPVPSLIEEDSENNTNTGCRKNR